MQSYQEFLDLSVGFPQEGFEVIDDELYFHDLNLMEMIETYGTPLRFTYIPLISKKIQQAKLLFQKAIVNNNYRGTYMYTYCTKSSHFRHIIEEALKNDVHLETSSAFDMPVIDCSLYTRFSYNASQQYCRFNTCRVTKSSLTLVLVFLRKVLKLSTTSYISMI